MLTLEDQPLIDNLRAGGKSALTRYFVENRSRLSLVVNERIQPVLKARVDGSDILQNAFLRAHQSFSKYLEQPKTSVWLWLRRICLQELSRQCKHHIDTQKRTIDRESLSLDHQLTQDESVALTPQANTSTPSSLARRNEIRDILLDSIEQLSEQDKAIIRMLHQDGMNLREAAAILDIGYEAAKKRYRRAANRLAKLAKELEQP